MVYFYEFELILVGIILLTAMTYVVFRLWWKRKIESTSSDIDDNKISWQNNGED